MKRTEGQLLPPAVLIVSGDAGFRRWTTGLLRTRGLAVMAASSAAHACRMLADISVGLVVGDLSTLSGYGLFLIQAIHDRSPRVRVVAISANPRLSQLTRLMGVETVLPKPLQPVRLVQAVTKALPLAGAVSARPRLSPPKNKNCFANTLNRNAF